MGLRIRTKTGTVEGDLRSIRDAVLDGRQGAAILELTFLVARMADVMMQADLDLWDGSDFSEWR